MKKIMVVIAVLSLFWGSLSLAEMDQEREVLVGVSGVYAPEGLNSFSEAYVIVSGVFQNGCYKWKRAEVDHLNSVTHEIRSIATVSPGMCIMVLVPFQSEVRLGFMSKGNHLLRFINGDGTYTEKVLLIQ